MQKQPDRLRPFAWRVRFVRAWSGLAIGVLAAGMIDVVWSVLDWTGVAYTHWLALGTMVGVLALLGGMVGLVRPVSQAALADSIDRRAQLQNRLASARQTSLNSENEFEQALIQDAESRLGALKPSRLYPFRTGRLQLSAVLCCAMAASLFLLGNTPLLLSEKAKQDRAKVQAQAKNVERVEREAFETPTAKREMTEAEKRLADELNRLKRDEEKARMSPEEARQRENELAKKADELAQQSAKSEQSQLATAQTARQQLEREALDKAGLNSVPDSMASMSDQARAQAMAQNQADQSKIEAELAKLRKQLQDAERQLARKDLTPEQRAALEKLKTELTQKIAALEHQLSEKQSEAKALQLSKEAQAVFAKMAQDPLYKKLQEMMQKLSQSSGSGSSGEHKELTDAEREALRREMEELAAKLKDSKAMKAYLEALMKALQNGGSLGRCAGIVPGLGLNLGPHMWGPSGPGEDWMKMQYDTGKINTTKNPVPGGGKTTMTSEIGDQGRGGGPETYVEIKAPATVGNRSSVPYVNVLPSYRKKEEEALHQQRIPKEEEKRVKQYFESLNGGG